MKNYKNIAVWFLVSLLVFAITPKDIFHEFHEHANEIEHIDLDCHNQHFEIKHTHCPVLKQVAPVFFANVEISCKPFIKTLAIHKAKINYYRKTTTRFMFGLKAPPALKS